MSSSRSPLQQLQAQLNGIVLGQERLIRQLLVALLSGGHVIIEGVPGTGKTLLVKAIAQLLHAQFRRVQLTPDILPADILGTNVFDLNQREFSLKKGPIFTEILLADEINRTPPKTQAALLEAMEELQVTLDGQTLPLGPLFWVVATQNPLEFEGTYPLPEAQLDRFLFKLVVSYPEAAAEKQMLLNQQQGFRASRADLEKLQPLASVSAILSARQSAAQVNVNESLIDYLLALVARSRQHPEISLGASPRATGAWLQAAKAHAWLDDRDYATPDDLKAVANPLLQHRLILKADAMLDNVQVEAVIASVFQQVPVPR